mmetsp:Transcript_39712/g.94096  ORF Transcript_39712/g.94096 Transcript_39712/m.94096 type:complete len:236 (-) Transcript_39712:156-863(-)
MVCVCLAFPPSSLSASQPSISAYAARIHEWGSREDDITRKSFGIFHAVVCFRPLHGPNCLRRTLMMLLDPVLGTLTYAIPARRHSSHGTCPQPMVELALVATLHLGWADCPATAMARLLTAASMLRRSCTSIWGTGAWKRCASTGSMACACSRFDSSTVLMSSTPGFSIWSSFASSLLSSSSFCRSWADASASTPKWICGRGGGWYTYLWWLGPSICSAFPRSATRRRRSSSSSW